MRVNSCTLLDTLTLPLLTTSDPRFVIRAALFSSEVVSMRPDGAV
jgi:hypothetical protein